MADSRYEVGHDNRIIKLRTDLDQHENDFANPHKVKAADVGLGNVKNLAPEDMPISKYVREALDKTTGGHIVVEKDADKNLLIIKLMSVDGTTELSRDAFYLMVDTTEKSLADGNGYVFTKTYGSSLGLVETTDENGQLTRKICLLNRDGQAVGSIKTDTEPEEITEEEKKLETEENISTLAGGDSESEEQYFLDVGIGAGVENAEITKEGTKYYLKITLANNKIIKVELPSAAAQIQADWNQTNPAKADYIKNKPDIPEQVTEQTVADWGFTKNKGSYNKPTGGIPKSDLASDVKDSLDKADTALQSYTETDPVFNASPAAGITNADITNWNNKAGGEEFTSAEKTKLDNMAAVSDTDKAKYDGYETTIAGKQDEITADNKLDYDLLKNTPTIPEAQAQVDWEQTDTTKVDYIKNKPDLDTKQDKLESGTNIKTINNETILGEGNIEVITDLTKSFTQEEKVNIANQIGLPEYPQTKVVENINKNIIKITELTPNTTYKIPYYQNLGVPHHFSEKALPVVKEYDIADPDNYTTIKDFIDNEMAITRIAKLENVEIFKSGYGLNSNTIYNYYHNPTLAASDYYYSYPKEHGGILVIKVTNPTSYTYYFKYARAHADGHTAAGVAGIFADIPLVASASYDYENNYEKIVGNTYVPQVTSGCNCIGCILPHVWYKQTVDRATKAPLEDIQVIGRQQDDMTPHFTYINFNDFDISAKFTNESEVYDTQILLEILNGSTYQGVDVETINDTQAAGYTDVDPYVFLDMPKYLDLEHCQEYQALAMDSLNPGDASSIFKEFANSMPYYPYYTFSPLQKIKRYFSSTGDLNDSTTAITLDKSMFVYSCNAIGDMNKSGTGLSLFYLYSEEDIPDLKHIVASNISCNLNTPISIKKHTWYKGTYTPAGTWPYPADYQHFQFLTEIPQPEIGVAVCFGSSGRLDIIKEIVSSIASYDEDGTIETHSEQVGYLTSDKLKQVDGLQTDLDTINSYVINLAADTNKALEDVSTTISNIQTTVNNIEPLKTKVYSTPELIDGTTYNVAQTVSDSFLSEINDIYLEYNTADIYDNYYELVDPNYWFETEVWFNKTLWGAGSFENATICIYYADATEDPDDYPEYAFIYNYEAIRWQKVNYNTRELEDLTNEDLQYLVIAFDKTKVLDNIPKSEELLKKVIGLSTQTLEQKFAELEEKIKDTNETFSGASELTISAWETSGSEDYPYVGKLQNDQFKNAKSFTVLFSQADSSSGNYSQIITLDDELGEIEILSKVNTELTLLQVEVIK